jgi:MarR family 2-MHQ and catechol resistance regulon transcriptional repressor
VNRNPEGGVLPARRKEPETRARDSALHKDAEALNKAVSELVRVYQFRDRTSICYYDISVTQCYALSAVIRRGPMPLNELAGELFLDKSTASRVVGSLVRKGYVSRTADPEDARALRLKATRRGRDLEAKIVRDLVEEMKKLVSDYDPETRRATARLISRLAHAASRRFGREGAAE